MKYKMLTLTGLLGAVLVGGYLAHQASGSHVTSTNDLIEAAELYQQVRPKEAAALFQKILKDESASLEDRAEAGQLLARINDHVYANTNKARDIIKYSLQLDPQNIKSLEQSALIERNAGNFEAARQISLDMIAAAKSSGERNLAYRSYATTTLDEALKNLLSNPGLVYPLDLNQAAITKSIAMLDTVLTEDLSHFDLLITQFKLATLLGKGKIALQGWSRYFTANSEGKYSRKLILKAYAGLKNSLEHWDGQPLDITKRKKLVFALADAWIFDLASVYAKTLPPTRAENNPRIADIMTYYSFLTDIKAISAEFYKESVLPGNRHKTDQYSKALNERMKALWKQLNWTHSAGSFSRKKLLQDLERRFGTIFRQRNANGWYSLLCGHLVIDGDMEVEQYGKGGRLKFKSIDLLAVTPLRDWYFGEIGNVGGWASSNVVYEVRASNLKIPFEAWRFTTDPESIKSWEQKIAKLSPRDKANASQNPVSAPQGLGMRLLQRASTNLLNQLKKRGLTGEALQRTYISEIERIGFEFGIVYHEGRHAIDFKISSWFSSEELEFRAKLSEIAFTSYPFIPLGKMLRNGINDTAHGKANKKLIEGLIKWMDKNKGEIAGLNTDKPLVLQLDLLSNDQLREAVRSLDPLASQNSLGSR